MCSRKHRTLPVYSAGVVLASIAPRSGGKGKRHKTRRFAESCGFSLARATPFHCAFKVCRIATFEPIEIFRFQGSTSTSLGLCGSLCHSHKLCLKFYSKIPVGCADFRGTSFLTEHSRFRNLPVCLFQAILGHNVVQCLARSDRKSVV